MSGLTFDRDEAVEHLRAADPLLAHVIELAGPYDVEPDLELDPFAYLLRSIVHQQLNGTAAATIHGRVLDLFDGHRPDPSRLLDLDEEALRAAGLSASKLASVRDLAVHAMRGEVPSASALRTMADADVVERLTVVRGIGPWTVHMLLMFQLGRPDVLPTGDFGVREGWRLLHGVDQQPTPGQLRAACVAWRPYRSVGAWYMWRVVDLHRAGVL